jgi:hypothetical protein
MKIDVETEIEEILPREREMAIIKDRYAEGMYLNLIDSLCRASEALALRARMRGDDTASSYHQGQVDAYRSAYQHYLELK